MRDAVAPSSLPLSVSVSVCLRWTVPGLLLLGDGRRLGDRDGWPWLAGLSPGRWAGVGVSGPVGGVLGASSPAGASSPSPGRWVCRAAAGALLLPAGLGLAGDTMGGVGSCWALIWGAPGLGLGFVKLHKFRG